MACGGKASMKDIRKFEEYGRSLAERVAQGKFNKEKVEKTIRSKAKKATSFMPYQNYYSEYALKAFNERFAEITGKPGAAEKGVAKEVQRYFPEGLSKAQPGSEPPMADSPFEVLPDDEPGFEYSDIEIHTEPYTTYGQSVPTGAQYTGGPFPVPTEISYPPGNWTFTKWTIGGDSFTGYSLDAILGGVRGKGWELYQSRVTGKTRARRRIARR